ncbi:MAG TPA: ABC transporter permease [Candidatus Limnocylindrales bacterium]
MTLFKVVTRLLAFVGKELVEVIRRPGAIFSLIVGPFLILAIFGIGYNGIKRPLQTVLVIPADSGLPQDAAEYERFNSNGLEIAGITGDLDAARALLAQRTIDLVVVAPTDLAQAFREGRQSHVNVEINETDPVQSNYAVFLADRMSAAINQEIIRRAAQEGEQKAASYGLADAQIPPEVVAAPTVADVRNIAPTVPGVIPFFGPAVVALILQHMAVTLTALSLVRERLSGVMELFRVAPVSALEILLGKYLAFGILNGTIAAAVVGLLVGWFHIPLLASPIAIAAVLALLVFSSLGLGLFISVVSDSERQAVQLSLLVLLASVFFSGFVINIDEFIPAVRTAAFGIPVTHGIRLLQDFFLRGGTIFAWEFGALGLMGVVFFALTWTGLRRAMRQA